MDIVIQNTQECFVALWRELERTRQRFEAEYRRFCIRRVMREWFGAEATDDFIWDVFCEIPVQMRPNLRPSRQSLQKYSTTVGCPKRLCTSSM